jgi:hypothetical protein
MNDFNTMFPNFVNQCLSLKTLLTPVAFVLITGGLIASTIANYHNGAALIQSIGKIIVFVVLLVFLPTWGNGIVSIVGDTVTNVLKVDPAKIHDEYQAALQLKKSSDGNSSWWEKLISFTNIMESLISAFFILLGWIASSIEWWAYILQTAILFIGYALSPIFIGMMAFPSLQNTGRIYLFNLVGVMLWPLGWGVAGLITQGMIDFMTDQSFLSAPPVGGEAGGAVLYSLQNLMGLAFLGIWIIFSTIAAPTVIQKAFTNGVSAASSLFSGAFTAGSAAGTAGFMSLAGSMGGKAVPLGKDTLSQDGMKKAGAYGLSAAMAGTVAAAAALETLITASINGGQGGSSLIGSLAQMNAANKQRANSGDSGQNEKPTNEGFPQNDPAGDRTVAALINKTKNSEV